MQHDNMIERIADRLDATPEATAMDTVAGFTSFTPGSANRHFFNRTHTATIFSYYINTYPHNNTVGVTVTWMGTETKITLPATTNPELVAQAAMNALHSTIDTLNGTHPMKAVA